MSGASKEITRDEVAKNTSEDSLWIIVDSKVFDVSDFLDAHPGGETVLKQFAGTDATDAFYNLHRHEVLQKYASLQIGTVSGEKPQVLDQLPGDISPVPYAEPTWLTPQFKSPYFKESHRELRRQMRVWVDKHLDPEAQASEQDGSYISDELIYRMADDNIHAMRMGPGKHLKGRKLLDNAVKPEEFDYFHEMIVTQELGRSTARGFRDGNMAGMVISLPAVMNFCNDAAMKERVTNEVLSGKKRICLAITEAFAGSDVAGMQTTARKTEDGKHYIINGTKKWITNGVWCDYFVTGVKTPGGFSVILIERSEGVETSPIKTAYSKAAGTTFVTFDNVKVPVGNLLGQEDRGFYVIMSNFNHERWMMVCYVTRSTRFVVEECLKWANQRLVFGKRLVDQPVIREKLAKMIAHCEANQAWLENITFQMTQMSYAQQAKLLAGPIGLLKMFSTRSAHEVADESVQIFGGRGLTQTGMGKHIEIFHRTYKFDAILGGTEEILADLGVRQAMKNFPKSML